MDIRRLRYFLQVAEFGSLNATAEQVNLSQPSLSRQIRLLEEELGVSLFTRRRDGMVLSRDGLELRTRILGPLRQLEMALDEIKSHSSQIGGSVVFGMPSSAIDALASPLARRASAFPNMAVHIVEGSAGQMLKSLERGEIDIALLNAPPTDTKWRCEIEDLFVEELVLAGSADAGLSIDNPVSVEDLAQLPLVLPSPPNHPPPIRALVEILSGLTDGKCNFPAYADSFQLTKSYVEAGIGYSVFPHSAVSHEAERGALTYAPISGHRLSRHMVLGTYPGGQYPRALERVKEMIKAEIVELAERNPSHVQLLF
ncbi:LysR family transcriptional regulator [Novosphingobium mangrovi (ex Huang et al. 2023)]|uniref:LysR family transcriptional regulator n=1 Tax=Novosphingobium mangrovi (ex Huang et al. 2023) TaxID=2976432 RepID=A0ABT2I5V0_9SPHN|nr:LysR family transcriptional regulator [Novosphingobium mangrovi (ex Huang et al. 2023)]MCT2399927.1 LysR family transcriptional regulator [Novosphingobium mangrovi (ex Huang et al. 2023)]